MLAYLRSGRPETDAREIFIRTRAPYRKLTVIRSWLGHVSLDTTNHYAKANLETKRKALEQVDAPTTTGHPPSWKRDASLLAWLDRL